MALERIEMPPSGTKTFPAMLKDVLDGRWVHTFLNQVPYIVEYNLVKEKMRRKKKESMCVQ